MPGTSEGAPVDYGLVTGGRVLVIARNNNHDLVAVLLDSLS